jgi:hypothetical protein
VNNVRPTEPARTTVATSCNCPSGAKSFDELVCTDAQTKTRTDACERCAICVNNVRPTEPPRTTVATACECPSGAKSFDELLCTDAQTKTRTEACQRCAICVSNRPTEPTRATEQTRAPCECPAGAKLFDSLQCTDAQTKTRTDACERCAICVAGNVRPTEPTPTEQTRAPCECPAGAKAFDELQCTDAQTKTRSAVCERCGKCTDKPTDSRPPVDCACADGQRKFDGLVCEAGTVKVLLVFLRCCSVVCYAFL